MAEAMATATTDSCTCDRASNLRRKHDKVIFLSLRLWPIPRHHHHHSRSRVCDQRRRSSNGNHANYNLSTQRKCDTNALCARDNLQFAVEHTECTVCFLFSSPHLFVADGKFERTRIRFSLLLLRLVREHYTRITCMRDKTEKCVSVSRAKRSNETVTHHVYRVHVAYCLRHSVFRSAEVKFMTLFRLLLPPIPSSSRARLLIGNQTKYPLSIASHCTTNSEKYKIIILFKCTLDWPTVTRRLSDRQNCTLESGTIMKA